MVLYNQYNTKMRFDGDIIITDPCYVVRDKQVNYKEAPYWWDFLSKAYVEKVETNPETGIETKFYHYPKASEYEDCRIATREDYEDGEMGDIRYKVEVILASSPQRVSDTLKKEIAAYYKAEEEWHDQNKTPWEECEYGQNMPKLGFTTGLVADTKYGDWSCTTFAASMNNPHEEFKPIGHFCADAGLVCVLLLDEVLKHNPEFNYEDESFCATIIKDFHGEVEIRINEDYEAVSLDDEDEDEDSGYPYTFEKVEVHGVGDSSIGKIQFVGKQTGF